MNISDQLHKRLEKLGWTLYKLAKQYSELRAVNGEEPSSAMRYYAAVSKAMQTPPRSRFETIEGIVQALGGELKIEWQPLGKPEPVIHKARDWSPSLAQYQVKFYAGGGVLIGVTYFDSFMEAFHAAMNYHCTSTSASADVWHGVEKICSSGEIIQICQKEQVLSEPVLDRSNSGFIVIRDSYRNPSSW